MKPYGTYERVEYNTCPIRFPVGKAAKALLFALLFVAMLATSIAAFAVVYTVSVAVLAMVTPSVAGVAGVVVAGVGMLKVI